MSLAGVFDGVLREVNGRVVVVEDFVGFLEAVHGGHLVAGEAVVARVRVVDETVRPVRQVVGAARTVYKVQLFRRTQR